MKFLTVIIILAFSVTGCAYKQVNREDIITAYSKITVSDGVNKNEMMVIAQNYMLTTLDEPCKSELADIGIERPFVKCGWVEPGKDQGCYVGFLKKGLFNLTTLYVKVSEITGMASCAGYMVLK